MYFGDFFDGYLVLHSSKLSPERLPYLKKDLDRVGVKAYQLVEPIDIDKNDPRLVRYKKGTLSHICSVIKCIEIAEEKKMEESCFYGR